MLKTIALLVAGTALGAGAMMFTAAGDRAGTDDAAGGRAQVPGAVDYFDDSASVAERLATLERTVTEERNARLVLEEQITLLLEELDRLEAADEDTPPGSNRGDSRVATSSVQLPGGGTRAQRYRARQLEQLTAAGFGASRAEAVLDRASELQWEIMQENYVARNEGRGTDWWSLDRDPNWRLRQEIGEDEYAEYLAALGQPTAVMISNVYDSSPASRVGLEPGDQIVAYNGTRVFTMTELRGMSVGGDASGDVVIDVVRDGTRMQLTLPAGPMGVQVSGSRGTISRGRSN